MSIINEALKKAGKGEGHLDSSLKVTAQAPREVPVPLLQPAEGRDSAKPFLHRFGYWAGGAVLVAGILWLYRPNLATSPARVTAPDSARFHELVQVSMAPAAAPPQAGMKPETQVFTNTFDTMPIPDDPRALTLSGILWDEHDPYAILNDRIVHRGDPIGSAVVREIRESEIVLETRDEIVTLKLF